MLKVDARTKKDSKRDALEKKVASLTQLYAAAESEVEDIMKLQAEKQAELEVAKEALARDLGLEFDNRETLIDEDEPLVKTPPPQPKQPGHKKTGKDKDNGAAIEVPSSAEKFTKPDSRSLLTESNPAGQASPLTPTSQQGKVGGKEDDIDEQDPFKNTGAPQLPGEAARRAKFHRDLPQMPDTIKRAWTKCMELPGRGASKTELKRLLFDEYFKADCQWAKSGVYTMMSTIMASTLERTEREWVSWDNYVKAEGQTVSDKQKQLGLIVERPHPRCPGEKQYALMKELSRDEFHTQLKASVKKQAEMDGASMDLYFKLMQAVLSNGTGMKEVLVKKSKKVWSVMLRNLRGHN